MVNIYVHVVVHYWLLYIRVASRQHSPNTFPCRNEWGSLVSTWKPLTSEDKLYPLECNAVKGNLDHLIKEVLDKSHFKARMLTSFLASISHSAPAYINYNKIL